MRLQDEAAQAIGGVAVHDREQLRQWQRARGDVNGRLIEVVRLGAQGVAPQMPEQARPLYRARRVGQRDASSRANEIIQRLEREIQETERTRQQAMRDRQTERQESSAAGEAPSSNEPNDTAGDGTPNDIAEDGTPENHQGEMEE